MSALDPFFGVTEGLLSPGALTGCTTIIDAWETPPGEIQWLDPETLETLKRTTASCSDHVITQDYRSGW